MPPMHHGADTSSAAVLMVQTDTTIRLAATRDRQMMGMCGTNDGNITNDRIGPNNTYGATGECRFLQVSFTS